jgi:hypothetical protein
MWHFSATFAQKSWREAKIIVPLHRLQERISFKVKDWITDIQVLVELGKKKFRNSTVVFSLIEVRKERLS